ncbi:MAG TPA: SusC/RagA family TonB-linked outer membrane protein, partial [Paludibacteraceae bacterium]|nr:SusC/RagA family TonB-linked outer membrane protein [Paludibacteraceae bacterium]
MRKQLFKRRTFILFTLMFIGLSNMGFAQKVSLNSSQQTLKQVLESISRQTGYTLAYSKEVVNLNEIVNINVSNASLSDVMTKLLSSRNLSYEIRDKKIYIAGSQAPKLTSQQNQPTVLFQGKVIDEKGDPIIGANISIPNSSIGTVSNATGSFSLSVPAGSVVHVTYIGYVEQQFTVNSPSTMNITLKEDTKSLNELVVIGYGVQKKSVVTAAISRVTAEQLNNTKPSRVEDVLKGKVSGVQITQSSGQPGSDSKVRIRGIGTVNNSEPLYIVDGMPVDGGINYLNPVDIQSVEILKDASSAAIYGARAANGVVLVTTKNGVAGKTKINYNVSYGWQNPWKKKSVLNAQEYMVIMNEGLINDGGLPRYNNEQVMNAGTGTDWQDETFNYNAPIKNHQLSVSGGTERSQYFLSLGYFDQQGIVGGDFGKSNYNRWSVRSNSTHTIFEEKSRDFLNKLRIGVNLGYSRDKSSSIDANSEYGSILGSALTFSPLVPVYADEETAAAILAKYPNAVKDKDGRVFSIPPSGFQEIANPVAMLNQPSSGLNNSDKIVSTFWGELSVLPELKFKSSYGVDLAFWGYDSYTFPYFLATQGKTVDVSTVQSEMNRGFKWQVENTLSYNKTFGGKHNVAAVLGQSAQKYTYRSLGGNDQQLLETDPLKANINSAIADRKLERVWGGTGG